MNHRANVETESERFGAVFEELGIEVRKRADGGVDSAVPLRVGGVSLQVYFNEPARGRAAYFAFNPTTYEDFAWSPGWQPIENDRRDKYVKYMPAAGSEREALERVIAFRTRQP